MSAASVYSLSAEVLCNESRGSDWYQLELGVPAVAARAQPGNFVQLQCHPLLQMRRPMSIMLARDGKIEILYRATGHGTRLLAGIRPGVCLNVLGPLGVPFRLRDYRPNLLLIGGGVGIPPLVFLADHLRRCGEMVHPLVLMGATAHLPFTPRASKHLVKGLPPSVTACIPLLEDWGIASRLAVDAGRPGCYEGTVITLAESWLGQQDTAALERVAIYGCGPHAMLRAVAGLAHKYGVPAEVSIEEYMPCGIGGCGACAVPIIEDGITYMKRVCVDGPVFPAETVFPPSPAT